MDSMNNDILSRLLKEAISDADLSISDIPSIDLYLDQILSLVSDKNAEGSQCYRDRALTKTMINNYSKEGAILPIKGKKYNKQQILQILFIYSLKNTLSIGEIKRMFEGAYRIEGFGEKEFSALWEDYLSIKTNSRACVSEICESMIKECELDLEKDEEYIRVILGIVSLSSYFRTMAQLMIEDRFPKEVVSSKEEKPQKEKKKKEKNASSSAE